MTQRPSATAAKALGLLSCFNEAIGALGLSDMARRAAMDKTTTLRHAKALVGMGFLEQDPKTKLYHIGAEVLRLARVREQHNPLAQILQRAVNTLSQTFEETAHASLLIKGQLTVVARCIGPRQITVQIEQGLHLPFHTTASGLTFLAFSEECFVERALSARLSAVTERSPTDPIQIRKILCQIRTQGYGCSDSYYCDGVRSFSTPYFNAAAQPRGALTLQVPEPRFASTDTEKIVMCLREKTTILTHALGGQMPQSFSGGTTDAA